MLVISGQGVGNTRSFPLPHRNTIVVVVALCSQVASILNGYDGICVNCTNTLMYFDTSSTLTHVAAKIERAAMCHVVNKLLRIMMGPLCPPSPPLHLICILCHVCGAVRSCLVQVSVESGPLMRCAKAFRACDSPTISIVMHLLLLPLAMLTTKPRCLSVGIANYAQLELTFHTSSCPPSCLPCSVCLSGLLAGTFFCSTRNAVQSYGTRLRVRDCTFAMCNSRRRCRGGPQHARF